MSRYSQGSVVETVQVDVQASLDHPDIKSVYTPSVVGTPLGLASNPLSRQVTTLGDEEETRAKARRHALRVMSAFMVCFAAGWGDGVTGVVLPYIKLQFGLSYTLSGLLFVAVSCGYVMTAFTFERATNAFGRFPTTARRPLFFPFFPILHRGSEASLGFSLPQGRWFLMMAATFIHACFFLTSASSTTFPGVLAGFCMNGFAKGNMISTLNAYMVANPHTFGLGHMHSFFCIGALASPLICQTLIARGWPWQNFYYLSVTIPVINFFTVLMTFRSSLSEFLIDKEKAITGGISLQRIVRGDVPEGSVRPTVAGATAVDVEPSEGATTPKQSSRHNLPRNMFMTTVKTPTVWAFGFFISMYTGSEGVTSGYIVTYLLKMRSADPSVVGYANSAFWAGAAVGRLALGYTSPLMGRRKPYWIFAFIIFAMSFHLCIWFIPSFAIGWAMTALAGLSMGPVFPLSLEIASRNLSPAIISSALAIMSSMGNLGGAFYPFMTGLLSNAEGEKVIEPLVVSLLGTMFCFWAVTRAHFSYK